MRFTRDQVKSWIEAEEKQLKGTAPRAFGSTDAEYKRLLKWHRYILKRMGTKDSINVPDSVFNKWHEDNEKSN